MTSTSDGYHEPSLTRTKIIATLGPASESPESLRQLQMAGVDVFRLNFAHGEHNEMAGQVAAIRRIADELDRPVGILGDLGGPKIRLGPLSGDLQEIVAGTRYTFAREADPGDPTVLTTTYSGLIDDLHSGDRVLLADGTVALRVVEIAADSAACVVEQPGILRSGQGVNLPGVRLRMPSVTQKDRVDLAWALSQRLDFIGLSFVRHADDIRELRRLIVESAPDHLPWIVAKIEKPEAITELENILGEADVVMVARGDLGVEVDIVHVPVLQKQIIRACNHRRVPVITATQMLDSMERRQLPTRAEASDVANAVLDGSDALMLSGETAIGKYPLQSVTMMSRIIGDSEPLIVPSRQLPAGALSRNAATTQTRAVALAAIHAAEHAQAKLLVVLTHSGKTAIAVSGLRSDLPILALTDDLTTARRLCIAWGVRAVTTDVCDGTPQQWIAFVEGWVRRESLLSDGDRLVLVGTTDWSQSGKNLMLVHTVGGGHTVPGGLEHSRNRSMGG